MVIVGLMISILTSVYEVFTQQRGVVWISYGFINPLLLLLPRIIYYRWSWIRERASVVLVKRVELLGTLILAVSVPGSLFFHDIGVQYDRFIHFSTGILLIFMASLSASIFYKNHLDNKKHILKWSGMAVFVGFFLFEFFQFSTDKIFGTHLFFDLKQKITIDVTEDISFATFGLIFGLLAIYHRFDSIFIKK